MANCREYCLYSGACKDLYPNIKGEDKLSSDDCPCAWKIQEYIEDMDTLPFTDEYDGPEVEDVL